MAGDHGRLGSESVEQADHVANEVQEGVLVNRVGAVALAIATHVRRHSMETSRGQRWELVAPGIPALRKTMTEDNEWTHPLLSDVDTHTIRLDHAMLYLAHHDLQRELCAVLILLLASLVGAA